MIILLFGTRRITSGLLCDSALMAFALHYRKVLSTPESAKIVIFAPFGVILSSFLACFSGCMLRKGFFLPLWSCGSGDVVGGGSETIGVA